MKFVVDSHAGHARGLNRKSICQYLEHLLFEYEATTNFAKAGSGYKREFTFQGKDSGQAQGQGQGV